MASGVQRPVIVGPKMGERGRARLGVEADEASALPYAADRRVGWWWVAVIVALLGAGGLIAFLVANGDDDGVETVAPTTERAAVTTTEPPRTTEPPTTTTPPTTEGPPPTQPRPARPVVLPPHMGIYRDGKLYLVGALPHPRYSRAFEAEAAAVIGPENVVNQYIIDARAPTPDAGMVRVDEPFQFDTGSAALKPEYNSLLNLGVAVMQLNPQVIMTIEGHTDEVGTPQANQLLSLARANAVKNYIVLNGRIDPNRFVIVGKGESEPLADNATPQGRQQNRRIEVRLDNLLEGL